MDKQESKKTYLLPKTDLKVEQNLIESTQTIRAECDVCGGRMQFVEGDVIFGEKWFHKDCSNTRLSSK